jgi:hypothetical protein
MKHLKCCMTALAVVLAVTSARGVAQERATEAPKEAAVVLSAEEIARLIRELDAPEFDVRERAAKKLVSGGAAVVDAVSQGAESDSLEVAARCLGVLKELYQSPDEATKLAARQALEKLAESRKGAVARRAKDVLNPPPVVPPAANPPNNPFPGLPMGVPVNVKVQSRTVNGASEINVEENDTKIRITHLGGRDITVTIRLPKLEGGKEPPAREFAAADAAALKEKHPEAYAYYEKYGTGRFPGAFPAHLVRFGAALPRIAEPPFPIVPFGPRRNAAPPQQPAPKKEVAPERDEKAAKTAAARDAARNELKRLTERLQEQAAKADVDPVEIRKLAEEIRAVTERLEGK